MDNFIGDVEEYIAKHKKREIEVNNLKTRRDVKREQLREKRKETLLVSNSTKELGEEFAFTNINEAKEVLAKIKQLIEKEME